MGVPGFFAWIIKKYPSDILYQTPENIIQALYLDWNGGIHPVCRSVLAKYNENNGKKVEELEDEMILEVLKYLQYVVSYVNPSETVFIAIDGVAPRAKMNQQRSRRFKAAKDKEIINNIKRKYKEPTGFDWDTNAITPGTLFMKKLCKAIRDDLKSNSFYSHLNVVFSDADIPMEGEHKIIQDIKTKPNKTCCIYGLDADLIFLSLLSENNIYLLRERDQFADVRGQKPFWFMSIQHLKEKLLFELDCKNGVQINPVKDFIILCYFLGNDFIPKLPCLFIHHQGIDILLETYKNIVINDSVTLVMEENAINKNFLIKFVNILSETEGKRLQDYHKQNRNRNIIPQGNDPLQNELYSYDNILQPAEDVVQLGKKGWKTRYYNHFFGFDRIKNPENVEEMVNAYIETLYWVWEYYTDGIPSWTWFYKYHHAPILSDIRFVLNCNGIKNNNFLKGVPLSTDIQLLCVLPPQSFHLLKKEHSLKLEKNIYYPLEFGEDCLHKKKRWQTIPNIPFINVDVLLDIIIKK
jgi:5'-3' exonuclease